MSWESSIEYYRLVNVEVRERVGGLHSADCLLRSVDFAPIEELQRTGRWDEAGELLAEEARTLAQAGAELLVLCTNTMHKVADRIEDRTKVPFVHIADTTADAVRACSAAPRSTCSSARRTRPCPCSTPRSCTRVGPSSSPSSPAEAARSSRAGATAPQACPASSAPTPVAARTRTSSQLSAAARSRPPRGGRSHRLVAARLHRGSIQRGPLGSSTRSGATRRGEGETGVLAPHRA